MALLQDDVYKSEQGFSKTIDEAGLGMVMDNLQRYQYQYPIKSCVREVSSNGEDSITEREIAKSILLGNSTVEEHYASQEGELFEASKFNPNYYDLNFLSDDPNFHIEYLERADEERDLIRFIDRGVGLGGSRLEGFFNLSYSTKRLNKSALGKFGIGAKAPLSTGVASYRMTSFYKGQKVVFDIFSRHIQSIVDKWDEEGNNNQLNRFDNGYEFYSEKTEELNGVIIELEVKKHQRAAYKEAVQTQLLYFTNVDFKIFHNDWVETVPVSTTIIFENEDFIISNNGLFTRPHLVLGAEGSQVNYGLIDFKELELEPRTGNIGIKVDGSEIEITPSRESVVWSPQTRDVILRKFQKALEEAENIVATSLQDEDILSWIDKNISLWSTSTGSNPVLKQLSGMINRTEIRSPFSQDKHIMFGTPKKMVGSFATYREVSFDSKYVNGKYKQKVNRLEVGNWNNISQDHPLFITRNGLVARKDAYIRETYGTSRFNVLTIPELDEKAWEAMQLDVFQKVEHQRLSFEKAGIEKETDWEAVYNKAIGEKEKEYQIALTFLEYATKSPLYVDYDSLVVPDDWKDNIASESETDENGQVKEQTVVGPKVFVDHAARRKAEGKVFFKYANWQTPYDHKGLYRGSTSEGRKAVFGWSQREEYTDVLNNFDGTLVYGVQTANNNEVVTEDQIATSDEAMLKMVSVLLMPNLGVGPQASHFDTENSVSNQLDNSTTYMFYPKKEFGYVGSDKPSEDLMLLKVSKALAKNLTHFIPIKRFMIDMDENRKIFTHMKLVNWFTAKQIHPLIQKLQFLRNFDEISPYHAAKWRELYAITQKYYFDQENNFRDYPKDLKESFVKSLDTMYQFQRWIAEDKPEAEEIAERSVQDFGRPASDALAVDLDVIKEAEALIEWAEPIVQLLNNIKYFTKTYSDINESTDKEEFLESIRFYLRSKSVPIKELDAPLVVEEVI